MDNNFGVADRRRNVLEDSDSDYSEKEDVDNLDGRDDRKVMGEEEDQFLVDRKPKRVKENWEDEDDEEEDEEELTNRSLNHSKMESESVISDAKLEPFDFNTLPLESCAYCGIHDVKCVV